MRRWLHALVTLGRHDWRYVKTPGWKGRSAVYFTRMECARCPAVTGDDGSYISREATAMEAMTHRMTEDMMATMLERLRWGIDWRAPGTDDDLPRFPPSA